MRFSNLSLSLPILLLPFLATALPQDAVSSEATTTSTSTSTLTVTRTLIRGTAVVIATLPDVSITSGGSVVLSSAVPTAIVMASSNSTITVPTSATGTGGKPILSTTATKPPLATFTGGAALMEVGGGNMMMMGMGMAVWALVGSLM